MKSLFFLCLLVFTGSLRSEVLEGVAKNRNGEILYLEKHFVEKNASGLNQFIRVEYSKPDGTHFATMISDFSKSKTLPQTSFEDKRFKTKFLIQLSNDTVEFEEYKEGKLISKKSFPFEKTMVASQGFDNFIQLNTKQLDQKPVQFNFGVLESKEFFSLTGYRRPASLPDETVYGIKASNWFFRLFSNELRVVYNTKNNKLKSFSGRSNILDDQGKAQDVVITYTWRNNP